ncbi:conserved hypothetical protein, secreted [Candidatus Magnetomorum sp. HK-1]|nr:conserved hypothetical protein, secreted [Candidatus Magnetomorum sp. HK-1]
MIKKILSISLLSYILFFSSISSAEEISIHSNAYTMYKKGNTWLNAIESWVSQHWISLEGSKWIWSSYKTLTPELEETYIFRAQFSIPINANIETIQAIVDFAADNIVKVYCNDNYIGENDKHSEIKSVEIHNYVNIGENNLLFEVTNYACMQGGICDSDHNPSGLLFKSLISYDTNSCNYDDSDSDGVIDVWDMCSNTPQHSYVDKVGCQISGLYTEEQMNEMVQSILSWGDLNNDNKIGLIEAIKALRVTSDVTEPAVKK